MCRILVISDIHGNAPALQAVAEQVDVKRCQYIINCGDSTVYAPFAPQVLAWLLQERALSILGNTDRKVVQLLRGKEFKKPRKPEKRVMYTHTAATLSPEHQTFLMGLPKQGRLDIGRHRLEFFHGSPERADEFLFSETPVQRLEQLAAASKASILISGHSHEPYHRQIKGIHFLNPGSVGRMFDGNPAASYLLLEVGRKKVWSHFHRCAYDVDAVVAGLKQAQLPNIYAEMYRTGRKLN
jgi:predicted phosphodiesterase